MKCQVICRRPGWKANPQQQQQLFFMSDYASPSRQINVQARLRNVINGKIDALLALMFENVLPHYESVESYYSAACVI